MWEASAHDLVPSSNPPYDGCVARRPGDQSSEGDWSINLKQHAETPNLTVELETADLKELAIEGERTINPMTVELSTMDIQFVAPGHSGHTVAEMGRISGESTSVFVDLGEEPQPTAPMAPTATLPSLPTKTVVDVSPPKMDLSHLLPTAPPGPLTPRSIAVPTPSAVSTRAQTAPPDDAEGGIGLVVIVYLLAAGALGVSIYLRWFG
jgi:hypothetical protein